MTYSEKLKDPRWQRKRLEILKRDNFTCLDCESNKKTLHVHHLLYIRGRDPWQYPNYLLETLCEDCHELKEQDKKRIPDPDEQIAELTETEIALDWILFCQPDDGIFLWELGAQMQMMRTECGLTPGQVQAELIVFITNRRLALNESAEK